MNSFLSIIIFLITFILLFLNKRHTKINTLLQTVEHLGHCKNCPFYGEIYSDDQHSSSSCRHYSNDNKGAQQNFTSLVIWTQKTRLLKNFNTVNLFVTFMVYLFFIKQESPICMIKDLTSASKAIT